VEARANAGKCFRTQTQPAFERRGLDERSEYWASIGDPDQPACSDDSMKPLHVVILSDFAYVNGGSAAVALASAEGLARRGHFVTVLSAVGAPALPIQTNGLRIVSTNQQEILKEPSRLRAGAQGIWNIPAARALSPLLRELDPSRTIIHVHSWTQALSSSVIRTALDERFQVVCTLHDYFAVCPNGTFFNHQKKQICPLPPMSASCMACHCDKRSYMHKLWRVARQAVQSRIGGMPTRIRHFIVVSEFSRSVMAPYLPPSAEIHRVQNPIQVAPGPPTQVARNHSFAMVGNISEGKGAYLFAKAARTLGCEALFVGDGLGVPEVMELYPGSRITGWVPRDLVTESLRSVRVLVFPSLWYETEGLGVIEAAALGIPAIVSNLSAARLSIVDGVTGMCFAGGDEQDLIRKMQAMSDDTLVCRMGQAAHARYWADPRTLDRHVSDLESVYSHMLARPV
jgi:glycosyltransferase involved in cell wall biosynthesis